MKDHFLLQRRDVIRDGDEFSLNGRHWEPTFLAGSKISKEDVGLYRRSKKQKPKKESSSQP